MEPEDLKWQVGWVLVGAKWGRKAEMLKKYWFFNVFEGSKGRGAFQEWQQVSEKEWFFVGKQSKNEQKEDK